MIHQPIVDALNQTLQISKQESKPIYHTYGDTVNRLEYYVIFQDNPRLNGLFQHLWMAQNPFRIASNDRLNKRVKEHVDLIFDDQVGTWTEIFSEEIKSRVSGLPPRQIRSLVYSAVGELEFDECVQTHSLEIDIDGVQKAITGVSDGEVDGTASTVVREILIHVLSDTVPWVDSRLREDIEEMVQGIESALANDEISESDWNKAERAVDKTMRRLDAESRYVGDYT